MNIFTFNRIGTALTPEERIDLEREIVETELCYSPESIAASIVSMSGLVGYWSSEIETQCLDHDLHFMKETLRTGIISMC